MEINPRIAGNHALPEYAGLDLAWFNFNRVVHNRIDKKVRSAPAGIRFCWTYGDLMGAKATYLRGEISFGAFITWLSGAIATALRSDVHMVFDKRDPYPAIRGLWNLFPRIARWRKPSTTEIGESTIYAREQERLI